MAILKKCDRCKKEIGDENEIGTVVSIYKYVPEDAYLRPSKKLLIAAKEENATLEYFPIKFKEAFSGQIDLCQLCFGDFMKIKTL